MGSKGKFLFHWHAQVDKVWSAQYRQGPHLLAAGEADDALAIPVNSQQAEHPPWMASTQHIYPNREKWLGMFDYFQLADVNRNLV